MSEQRYELLVDAEAQIEEAPPEVRVDDEEANFQVLRGNYDPGVETVLRMDPQLWARVMQRGLFLAWLQMMWAVFLLTEFSVNGLVSGKHDMALFCFGLWTIGCLTSSATNTMTLLRSLRMGATFSQGSETHRLYVKCLQLLQTTTLSALTLLVYARMEGLSSIAWISLGVLFTTVILGNAMFGPCSNGVGWCSCIGLLALLWRVANRDLPIITCPRCNARSTVPRLADDPDAEIPATSCPRCHLRFSAAIVRAALGRPAKGLTEEQIDALPHRRLTEQEITSMDDAACVICIEDMEAGEQARELPCTHVFHTECIDRWLLLNSTCPRCRESLTESDAPAEEAPATEVAAMAQDETEIEHGTALLSTTPLEPTAALSSEEETAALVPDVETDAGGTSACALQVGTAETDVEYGAPDMATSRQ
ncbi:hypothetical protein CYMTET_10494 [Cymbomonas tetramitiformis]|uniref:RING-type domain-containing protein n=1 Tax=Cymbomonas tetramitiformis TaxID=36881 RepID=A0AAE0GP21_9CHLO|nr:hypothetical protein CYMTET_10494 [Cymbomonas tetramitiformis]